MNNLKKKWLIFAVGGLLLLGSGLSLFGEALLRKWDNAPFLEWFIWGTFSLVVFNAGISLFGQAVIYRMKIAQKLEDE
ncbi:hypothetical protein [Cyclobacterium sp.]|uniref:hypothetical protein n=1 Tax=Cyclobacterium sp. TaxID=1966343 RepID=UPI0019A1799E|nr:hypothetical protein [Cyclobacterium sp.]MBD3627842.1 hypothetical protein [Cyclobacterium sp.]